jgi:hypothetical protein
VHNHLPPPKAFIPPFNLPILSSKTKPLIPLSPRLTR